MRTAIAKHTSLLALGPLLRRLALLGTVALLAPLPAAALAAGGASATGATAGGATEGAGGTATAGGTGSDTPTASRSTLATWFGPGFYGHSTACGQTMTPTLVGVASRTLPCGTLVQVGYRGRRLTVPVLDRGPYGHSGAVWDLTAGAARALKITETVRVAAQIVGSVPNGPTLGLPGKSTVPAGSTAGGTVTSTPAPGEPSASTAATGGATAG
jgi:rare lipoprotein A (peptidoglycan hydrolase)